MESRGFAPGTNGDITTCFLAEKHPFSKGLNFNLFPLLAKITKLIISPIIRDVIPRNMTPIVDVEKPTITEKKLCHPIMIQMVILWGIKIIQRH